jgi:hypothetical protein
LLDEEELRAPEADTVAGNGHSLPERDKTPTNRAEICRRQSERTLAVHYGRVSCLAVICIREENNDLGCFVSTDVAVPHHCVSLCV